MKTKIAIVGSRKITDLDFIEKYFFNFLSEIGVEKNDVMIVSGGARGVDTLAQIIAKRYGIPILIIYPDYKAYGEKAPLVRNIEIIKEADYILAFPSKESKGTLHVIKEAQKRHKYVKIIQKLED